MSNLYPFNVGGEVPSSPMMIPEINGSDSSPCLIQNTLPELAPLPDFDPIFSYPGYTLSPTTMVMGDTWTHPIDCHLPRQQSQQEPLILTNDVEEDSGIRLVHALLTCAEAIQCGELQLAASLVGEMTNGLLTRVNSSYGIGKVAGYFVEALGRRLFQPVSGLKVNRVEPGLDYEVLYHHFYEACPYLKFAHFTANQAILEAFEGHDCVHVIDFNLMNGLQWPALIQALALRPGGPPSLRLTGIEPALGNGQEPVREIGMKLAHLAQSVNMRFAFRAVATARLEDVKPSMIQTDPREAIAMNSILQLHRFLGSGIDPVLEWIRRLNPKIITVVEQEANHNQLEFLNRFTDALYYYSTMFDSLEICKSQPNKVLAEKYIQREISNIVCCEGLARVERHEPLASWRSRMDQAGFKQLTMSPNAYRQASMLLTLFSAEGYDVEEREGFITLGWHSRPLIGVSAWQVGPNRDSPSLTNDISSTTSLSN